MTDQTAHGAVKVLREALLKQMDEQADDNTPSSIQRDRGLVWLEGWFDLAAALIEALLTADRENSELLEAAIEGQSYWQARAERVEGAAQAVIDRMSSTYKARNGREVGIQGEDGEKCYIVHSDEIHALEAVLADAQQTQKPEPGSNEWLSRSPNFHPGDIA